MYKVTVQFHNNEIKTFKTYRRVNLHSYLVKQIPWTGHMYKSSNWFIDLLKDNKEAYDKFHLLYDDPIGDFFQDNMDMSVLTLFGAKHLTSERINGSVKSSRVIPYWSFKELILNY